MIPQPKQPKKWRLMPQDNDGLATSMKLSASIEERNLYCRIVQDVAKVYNKHKQRMMHVHVGSSSTRWKWFLGEVESPSSALLRKPEKQIAAPRSTQPRTRAIRSKPSPSRAVAASSSHFQADSAVSTRPRSSVARRRGAATPTSLNQSTQSAGTGGAGGNCEIDEPDLAGSAKRSKPDSFLGFLKLLRPPQPALLPVFVRLGVTSVAELRELPFVEKWLHDRVKEEIITEFQFAAIIAGLRPGKLGVDRS
ncbi:hypothetical protein GSI_13709 [Ganoderma sinense ZZ0214-1]|uniref:Uncharacterized protein n=1 Tax=Ganoderma sinense ZZ0214-1 TaxID=1077348 RepID=A0A2G8RRJ6_9APHY|nr:hypothetical protein GSI_13709 [Ganoderma sinense ZZ0214-1]